MSDSISRWGDLVMRWHRLNVDHEATPCGKARAAVGNYCYYVMNRSNARAKAMCIKVASNRFQSKRVTISWQSVATCHGIGRIRRTSRTVALEQCRHWEIGPVVRLADEAFSAVVRLGERE